MTGDLAINMWSNLFALYFNKQTVEEFKRESPYELVKSGKCLSVAGLAIFVQPI